MKIFIKNFEDHGTICPSQFSFEVEEPRKINSGYVRYRHGELSLTLYGKFLIDGELQDSYRVGIEYGDRYGGMISWSEAVEQLKENLGIHIVEVREKEWE